MWPYPKVLAHRGGGRLAPENTIAALACGLSHGFAAVEFDVMLSKDSVPVLMHDPDFGRTIAGIGNVATTAVADLQQMDAGAWFSAEFAGERVPTYAEAMAYCRRHGIWMNVEIKPVPGYETLTGGIVAAMSAAYFADVASERVERLPLLSSFSSAALHAAKLAAPALPRAWLCDRIEAGWQSQLAELAAVALHTNEAFLTPALARAVKDSGAALFCYTVNSPARARELLSWGVDGFCTDRIDLIAADFK